MLLGDIVVYFGITMLVSDFLVMPVIRRHLHEKQCRFQREYLALHGKLDSLKPKMDALEEQCCRMRDSLLAAISDGKPPGDLRALLEDTNAQLATLRTDYLLNETLMHAAMAQLTEESFDKVQKLLEQPSQPPQTQPVQVNSSSSSAPLPGYSSVASEVV
ncbi:hypothetical protein HDU80_004188 [Chytriomyces hyalinus]|nr:hypothetical protein HDU80_004188 [Chytriomyces hyalinus]